MDKIIVTVIMEIKNDLWDTFIELMHKNAEMSIKESGCIRFDIGSRGENTVFLYEVYTSEKSFEEHLSSKHYQEFSRETEDMVINKTVEKYSLNLYTV